MKIEFPKFIYLENGESLLIQNELALKEIKEKWAESPSDFKNGDGNDGNDGKNPIIKEKEIEEKEAQDLGALSLPDLKKILIKEHGIDKGELKGKKKDELIEIIKNLRGE
jgi:hypothetical protein